VRESEPRDRFPLIAMRFVPARTGSLPRVELMEKTLAGPRSAIERGRSNPRLAIAVIVGVLLLIAWVAWAIYVTRDNGANAGLGVVLSWPVLLAALALIASPFVGLYLLVNYFRSANESEDAADEEEAEDEGDEDEQEAEEETEDEAEDETEDDPAAESGEGGDADEDAEEASEDGPEETDPDEEPPSGDRSPASAGLVRIAGNKTTSRSERAPVRIITRRSIPSPAPPVGGIPCSSASTKPSS